MKNFFEPKLFFQSFWLLSFVLTSLITLVSLMVRSLGYEDVTVLLFFSTIATYPSVYLWNKGGVGEEGVKSSNN